MACRADVCVLIAILVVLVVALLLFAARGGSACGPPFRGEGLTIWPVKWEARDN
jgi:hypothetical protein